MKIDKRNWILIQRYVVGSATAEEREIIDQWIEADSNNRKFIHDLELIWELTPAEDFELNVERAWNHFIFTKKFSDRNKLIKNNQRKSRNYLIYITRIAALIMVAFFAGFFVQQYIDTMNELAAEQNDNFKVMQELETDRGERARVTFSDGTKVTLNSASIVKFPEVFQNNNREVYLDGEAYFEVVSNPEQPFIVHTDAAEIRVLGTEFNIRGWNDDSRVDVLVSEGKVSVNSTGQNLQGQSEVILTDGMLTSIKKGEIPTSPEKVDVNNYRLWMSGGMHFNDKPFNQVIKDIERRFNVNITVSDEQLMEVPYTGIFQYAELDEVLSVIAATMEVEYTRDGAEIDFHN